jgi:hypothetical protein
MTRIIPYWRGKSISALTDVECREALIHCVETLKHENETTKALTSNEEIAAKLLKIFDEYLTARLYDFNSDRIEDGVRLDETTDKCIKELTELLEKR